MKHKIIHLYDIHDIVKVVPQEHRDEFFRWIGDIGYEVHNGALLQLDLVEIFETPEEYGTPEWARECLEPVIDALGDDATDAHIRYWW